MSEEAQKIFDKVIKAITARNPDSVKAFGQQCREYGKAKAPLDDAVASFYNFLVSSYGLEFSEQLLPTLVKLLPDVAKRELILEYARAQYLARHEAPPPLPPAAPAAAFVPPAPAPAPAEASPHDAVAVEAAILDALERDRLFREQFAEEAAVSKPTGPPSEPVDFENFDWLDLWGDDSCGGPEGQHIKQMQDILTRVMQYCSGLATAPGEKIVRAWHVTHVNEWNMSQERVVALSTHSYFRVKFDRKSGKIIKHVKLPMGQVEFIEELPSSATGILIFSSVVDGSRNPAEVMGAGLAKLSADEVAVAKASMSKKEYHVVIPKKGQWATWTQELREEIIQAFRNVKHFAGKQ